MFVLLAQMCSPATRALAIVRDCCRFVFISSSACGMIEPNEMYAYWVFRPIFPQNQLDAASSLLHFCFASFGLHIFDAIKYSSFGDLKQLRLTWQEEDTHHFLIAYTFCISFILRKSGEKKFSPSRLEVGGLDCHLINCFYFCAAKPPAQINTPEIIFIY